MAIGGLFREQFLGGRDDHRRREKLHALVVAFALLLSLIVTPTVYAMVRKEHHNS